MNMPSISIVIPAYNRPRELTELLDSVLVQTVLPLEVLVCEDMSPMRLQVRDVCDSFKKNLEEKGVKLNYVENEVNLGYDKNLRKCIESASSDWAMIMGNDDVLLRNAVEKITEFISKNPVSFISRSFLRFTKSIYNPLGVSSISSVDSVFNKYNSGAHMIFRSAGFVGGLVVNTAFARGLTTRQFDGSLYYQIYLAAHAYCRKGIGYIATPIVGGRAENPPMFGSAADDKDVHVPGGYTAEGRAKMWRGVLEIASTVGEREGCNLIDGVRNELMVRQCFHVFEMNAKSSRKELRSLKSALSDLGLFSHPLPRFLYFLNYVFGSRAKLFYIISRRVIQRG